MGRETSAALKELFERAQTWPEKVQADLVEILEQIDGDLNAPPLSEDDIAAIEAGLEDVRQGRTVPEEEVSALFDRYRGR